MFTDSKVYFEKLFQRTATHVVQKAFFRHAMAAVKNKAAGAGRVISRGYLSVAEQEKYGRSSQQ